MGKLVVSSPRLRTQIRLQDRAEQAQSVAEACLRGDAKWAEALKLELSHRSACCTSQTYRGIGGNSGVWTASQTAVESKKSEKKKKRPRNLVLRFYPVKFWYRRLIGNPWVIGHGSESPNIPTAAVLFPAVARLLWTAEFEFLTREKQNYSVLHCCVLG